MLKLSRGVLFAIAAAAAIPATYAIAKGVEHAAWHNMTPETRARLDEGRLAMAKAALKLSPDQDKLWAPIEAQVRDTFKMRDTKRAEWKAMREQHEKDRADGKKPDMAAGIDKMSQMMSDRATRMSAFAGAFKPFYASLSDEQKDVLRPLMHELSPGMDGRHGHHDHRFAEDGDVGGGWGGHHRHGGWSHHGEGRDGKGGDKGGDKGQGGGGGSDHSAPVTPQFAPDQAGDDEAPVQQDKL